MRLFQSIALEHADLESVPTVLHVYAGVPHTFGQMEQLPETKRFGADLLESVEALLRD